MKQWKQIAKKAMLSLGMIGGLFAFGSAANASTYLVNGAGELVHKSHLIRRSR